MSIQQPFIPALRPAASSPSSGRGARLTTGLRASGIELPASDFGPALDVAQQFQQSISGDSLVHLAGGLRFLSVVAQGVAPNQNIAVDTPPVKEGFFWYVPQAHTWGQFATSTPAMGVFLQPPNRTGFNGATPALTLDGDNMGVCLTTVESAFSFGGTGVPFPVGQRFVVPSGWFVRAVTLEAAVAPRPDVGDRVVLNIAYIELPLSFNRNDAPLPGGHGFGGARSEPPQCIPVNGRR